MSLEKLSEEEIAEMSMLEIAFNILKDEKKAMDIHEMFDIIAEKKGFTDEEKDEKFVQFYTDLNVDGRFVTMGNNLWGAKRWYPVDEVEEELTHSAPKKKKKAKKKKVVEEEELDVLEEEEDFDLEDDLDEDDLDEDLDDLDDDLEDVEDEDLDFDEEEEEDFDLDEDEEE